MTDLGVITDYMAAQSFVESVKAGFDSYDRVSRFENIYGPAEGFVYFAAIGDPQPVYLKVGFSRFDPRQRVRGLQTGCPFPIRLLGFVMGCRAQEAEIHDVFCQYHVRGEWFDFTDYVESIVRDVLDSEFV